VFNKRTLCVEKSVHVLFYESNSLVENDAQDENFELGLARKIFCPLMKKVRIPRRDQAIDLFPRQRSKILNKQEELQQNPVWTRIKQTVQKQAPE